VLFSAGLSSGTFSKRAKVNPMKMISDYKGVREN
jgi:hypothetical protein